MSTTSNGQERLQINSSMHLTGEVLEIPTTPAPQRMWSFQLYGSPDAHRPLATWSIPQDEKVIVQARKTIKLGKNCIILSENDATDFACKLGIPTEYPKT
ncbi:hypothetical protein [Xanthomonas sp. BRIP62409]|uniref:hypothetical protein n=1 Tax=Xanthomonas sp. BRIP62409 TaxID=2182388 RepID=UPI000F8F1DE8|nr:hypothetical protein [Xanthomonas sp. BRIP62409]